MFFCNFGLLLLNFRDAGSKLYKLFESVRYFRLKIFILFHFREMGMQAEQNVMKLSLISFFLDIKLDDPALQYLYKINNKLIISIFLYPGGKT